VGLGQSHLSQKIPATTTRYVYLDHLLSVLLTRRILLFIFASYKGNFAGPDLTTLAECITAHSYHPAGNIVRPYEP